MIKAIIFDCFGVLCTDSWLPFKEMHFHHDPMLWRQASELNTRCDAGELSYQEFVRQVAELAGIPVDEAARQIGHNPVDEQLLAYIRDELYGKYPLGLLSNAGENWLHSIFTDEQVALFDQTVLSRDVGVTKPHPKMYQTIVQKLGVVPTESIFIDDQLRYIDGAKQVGMQTIHYTGLAILRPKLRSLLNEEREKSSPSH